MELKVFGGHSMSYKTIYILKTCMFMPKFSSWKMVEIFPNKPLFAYLVRCANLLVLPLLLPMIPPNMMSLPLGVDIINILGEWRIVTYLVISDAVKCLVDIVRIC